MPGEQIYMRRFKRSSDSGFFLLDNDKEYPSQISARIYIGKIRDLMVKGGKIRSGLMHHHEISGKDKINALEKDLEILKKELFSMNKKLTKLSFKTTFRI